MHGTGWLFRVTLATLLGLVACSRPGPAIAPDEQFFQCREVYRPARGRVFDRHDSLLLTTQAHHLLTLSRGAAFDTAALNRLLGWPAGALQARVAAQRPPAGPVPTVPDSLARKLPPPQAVRPPLRWPVRLPLTAPEAALLRRYARRYPSLAVSRYREPTYTGHIAAQVLGYPPAAGQAYLALARQTGRGKFFRLRNGGVESYYNSLLAGRPGAYHPFTDGHGRVQGRWAADTLYRAGQDLHLSLDAGLQAYAERLLGERRGYIVALEPATGEILCYASGPTFDPAVLVSGPPSQRRALLQDTAMPLLNRPALLANPPGSVFKLVNAAVALQLKAIMPATGLPCDQSLIHCVHEHPDARNLEMALKYSCNPYFYQVLRRVMEPRPDSAATARDTCALRHRHLAAWLHTVRSLGLDTLLGVDLPNERPGFLPSPALYDKTYGRCNWGYNTIYSLSVGQGEINLTGLQTANVLACIANRGWYVTPHFVRAIGRSGQPLPRFRVRHHTRIDSANFAALIPGMTAALRRGGTAELASLADVGITVAGKTGTVQNDKGDDHATFAGFAPANQPKIVVAVYLENAGFGGLSAAPCASLIMEKYLRGRIAPKRKKWEWWLRCGDLASQGH